MILVRIVGLRYNLHPSDLDRKLRWLEALNRQKTGSLLNYQLIPRPHSFSTNILLVIMKLENQTRTPLDTKVKK